MSKIYTIATQGLKGTPVEVETNLSRHLPKVIIVGLPDTAVQEARERVWAAIENSSLEFPRQKVVINLAPAQVQKSGGSYDLSMAVSILEASGQIKEFSEPSAFIGELSLTGLLKPVPGVMVMVAALKTFGIKRVFVPAKNAKEASVIEGVEIYPVNTLAELVDHLNHVFMIPVQTVSLFVAQEPKSIFDLSEVRGQVQVKRALEIAAAGGHNLLMVGPPGAGKTMLAKSFLSILPPLNFNEALEVSQIHSLAGLLTDENYILSSRFMRSPHHSASVSAIVGGGSHPKPGEISLSHRNVLFFDEILEFPRAVLEALRQPLEDKVITVSRVRGTVDFPADFILLASANPCPCGYFSDPSHDCRCRPQEILRYRKKLSGPLLDRIDLHITVPKVKTDELIFKNNLSEPSAIVLKRVLVARKNQIERQGNLLNCNLATQGVKKYCVLDIGAQNLLKQAVDKMQLSARSYYKILKVARTIADLENENNVSEKHVLEALQYRNKIWGEL